MADLDNRIPLVLVHGSLGSGKTTLLKQLLATEYVRGAFIIENEFAHENIDQTTLQEHVDDGLIAEISGGCVCCSSFSDMRRVLEDLARKNWTKPVVIETTGVASSTDLLASLYLDEIFLRKFDLVKSIMVLDTLSETVDSVPFLQRELITSDCVVLSKTDLAVASSVETLECAVRAAAPHITLVRSGGPAEQFAELFSHYVPSQVEQYMGTALSLPKTRSHDDVVYTVCYPESKFSVEDLYSIIAKLIADPTMNVMRVKGYVLGNNGGWWHVEATRQYHNVVLSNVAKKAAIVCIGKNVSARSITPYWNL